MICEHNFSISSKLWDVIKIVELFFFWKLFIYFLINSDVDTSNDAVGSSNRSNLGLFNKALHKFTLVFWPEDNVP